MARSILSAGGRVLSQGGRVLSWKDKLNFEPETIAYLNRVTADGGVINDISSLNDDVVMLKSTGEFNKFNFIYLCYGGMRLRLDSGIYYIEKMYDLSSNNNDFVNTNTTSQATYGQGFINSIPSIITTDDFLNIPSGSIFCDTIITVNGQGGVIGRGIIGGSLNYMSSTSTQVRYRTPIAISTFSVLTATNRLDFIYKEDDDIYVYRNGVGSPNNPQINSSSLQFTSIFRQPSSQYWNGVISVVITATEKINSRALIEAYYMNKFNL